MSTPAAFCGRAVPAVEAALLPLHSEKQLVSGSQAALQGGEISIPSSSLIPGPVSRQGSTASMGAESAPDLGTGRRSRGSRGVGHLSGV
jgi:hypothetical protein